MGSRSQFKQINHALLWYYHIGIVSHSNWIELRCVQVCLIFACHIDSVVCDCFRLCCWLDCWAASEWTNRNESECKMFAFVIVMSAASTGNILISVVVRSDPIHCNLICVFYHSNDNLLPFSEYTSSQALNYDELSIPLLHYYFYI